MKNNSWFVNERKIKPLSQIERKPRITLQSKYWVKLMKILERTYEEHDEGRRLMIKYEDLRFNTLETLKKIYQFIDVKITDDDLKNLVDKYNFENIPKEKRGSGKVTRSASPGKWKESFNKEEINIMEKIMGNTLKKFNYKL